MLELMVHKVTTGFRRITATFGQDQAVAKRQWPADCTDGDVTSDRQKAAGGRLAMFVVSLAAVRPSVLREDVGQAQTKVAITSINVPEVLTVSDLHAVLHPYNVQRRRSCAHTCDVSLYSCTRVICYYCCTLVSLHKVKPERLSSLAGP